MSREVHLTYVGPIAHLVGKTALGFKTESGWSVQFDDPQAHRKGSGWPQVFYDGGLQDAPPVGVNALGYGWHDFNATDFTERERL